MKNNCQGLANAILSHSNDGSDSGQKRQHRCGISCGTGGKGAFECVCRQTSPKQKETRISCWRPVKQVMSKTSQPNLRLAFALLGKQDLPTNHQVGSGPADGRFSFAAKSKQSSETSHWARALNIKMASWSNWAYEHMFCSTEFSTMSFSTSFSSVFHAACRTKPGLLTCAPTRHIPMFQPCAQLAFLQRALGSHVSPCFAHPSSCHLGENSDSKSCHGYRSLDYVLDRC